MCPAVRIAPGVRWLERGWGVNPLVVVVGRNLGSLRADTWAYSLGGRDRRQS